MPPSSTDRALLWSTGLATIAIAWRVRLSGVYWGHEEEDWGNLEIVRGVLDSHFGYVETEHMPLFVWLAAAAARLLGDVHLASLAVPIVAGGLGVALTTWIGWRWLSPAAGVIAGALMCFQPESALYSASPLRESLYVALALGGIAAIGSRRRAAGAVLLSLAFLARFNVAFSLLPALAIWAFVGTRAVAGGVHGEESERLFLRRSLASAAAVAATVAAWAVYYHSDSGSWAFWGHVVSVNTGDAVSDLFVQERVAAVFGAVFGLFGRVLPTHVGWAVIPLAVVGGIAVTRGRARDRHGAAWLGLCALGTLALLASTATVSSYEWEHNLYWKWLTPSVPFLLLFGAHGGIGLVRRLGLRAGSAVAVGLIVATLLGYAGETRRQVDLSEQQYGTQVRLAQWLEESWDPRIGVVCDAIPAAWLRRRPSSIRIFDWTGPELPHDDPDAFGRWLLAQRIGLVMWYREEWVGAIDAAAYLADGNGRQLGPVRLDRIAREDGYGLIAFQVSGPGLASPRTPPPADLPGGAQ